MGGMESDRGAYTRSFRNSEPLLRSHRVEPTMLVRLKQPMLVFLNFLTQLVYNAAHHSVDAINAIAYSNPRPEETVGRMVAISG